jgi:hypothetical protein
LTADGTPYQIDPMSDSSSVAGSDRAAGTSIRFPAFRHWDLDSTQTALLFGIILLTVLAFLRTLNNGFVYDDYPALVRNHRLREWSFIWESLTRDVWWFYGMAQPPQSSYYRPLQNVCLGLGFHLVGVNAAGWHSLKIVLHLFAVLASFRLAQLLTASTYAALLVALIFALMPSNGAAIISIQAIGEPLAAAFAMASLSMFIQRSRTRGAGMAGALVLFTCAAFSHETAVLFPILVGAYVFLFETNAREAGADAAASDTQPSLVSRAVTAAVRSAPFVIVVLFYLGARALVLGPAGVLGLNPHKNYSGPNTLPVNLFQPHPIFSSAEVLMTVPTVMVHYIELMIFPWMAEPAHAMAVVSSPTFTGLFIPVAILLAIAIAGFFLYRRSPRTNLVLFCTIWWLVSLAPAFSFNHIVQFVQDRYLYLASFAFCLWLAICVIDFVGDSVARARAVSAVVVVLTIVCLVKLYVMEPIWHDNVSLFTRCVEDFPDSSYYHRVLASTLMKNGDFAAAAAHLRYIYKPEPQQPKEKEPGKPQN